MLLKEFAVGDLRVAALYSPQYGGDKLISISRDEGDEPQLVDLKLIDEFISALACAKAALETAGGSK
jgi:hypothetical protein